MRKLLIILALLCSAWGAYADSLSPRQTMHMAAARVYNPNSVNVLGNGGHAFGPTISLAFNTYAPAGVQFLMSQLLNNAQMLDPSNVSGGSSGLMQDGCKGLMVARIREAQANFSSAGYPTFWNDGFFVDYDLSSTSSDEGVRGLATAFDTNGWRTNFNNSAGNQTNPFWNNAIIPIAAFASLNDVWFTLEISWNTCSATTYYASAYINGVNVLQSTTAAPGGVPLPINYSFTGGTLFGGAAANILTNQSYFDVDDLVVDYTHDVLVGHNSTTIASSDLQHFYNSGPVRINAGGACSDTTGWQPTVCFTTDGAYGFGHNYGYGGSYVFSGTPLAPAGIPYKGLAAGTVGQKWESFNPVQVTTHTGTGLTTNSMAHVISVNDLLILTANVVGTTASEVVNCPSGWTTILSSFNPGTAAATPNTFTACYHVAVSADTSDPAYTMAWTSSHNFNWLLQDYVGADPTNPIDVYSSALNVAKASSFISANIITNYPNELYVGYTFFPYSGVLTTFALTPPTNVNVRSNSSASAISGPAIVAGDLPVASPSLTTVASTAATVASTSQNFALGIKPLGATFSGSAHGTVSLTTPGNGQWIVPPGVTSITSAGCWGAGSAGAGGSGTSNGGSGGGYMESDAVAAVTPGQSVYYHVGAGGATGTANGATIAGIGGPNGGVSGNSMQGDSSWINFSANAVPTTAAQGCIATGGTLTVAGVGNTYTASKSFSGGLGGASSGGKGGGGGAGASATVNGAAGSSGTAGGAGGVGVGAGSGGAGQVSGGSNGVSPGGAGGGSNTSSTLSGYGGAGQVQITY